MQAKACAPPNQSLQLDDHRTKFEHLDQTPGRFIRYRVIAQRGAVKSVPSGTASVYDPSPSLSLVENSQAA